MQQNNRPPGTVHLPMPGMLWHRGWSQGDFNLTVKAVMELERIAWPQADVFDGYAIVARLIEDGEVTLLERVRDTVRAEALPAVARDPRLPARHP